MTDLEMPVMDGFELLAYMNKNKPNIPVYVMTANGSPEIEEQINSLGSIKYFEKPLDIDKLVGHITTDLAADGAKGKLQGIMLVSFLQLIEVEGKTCTLTVSSNSKTGTLSCVNGKLLNASVAGLKDLDAAYEMISWDNAFIEISNTVDNRDVEITVPLVNVIMEGLSRKDENAAL
jgi:CheY-like chemotaxis protein